MLVWSHIESVIERHFLLQFRDLYRLFDIFFWPLVDILLWGFTATWFEQGNETSMLHIILFGLLLWQLVYRTSLELAMNMLQELWDRNLAHLFSTPLSLTEWIIANLLLSIIRTGIYILVYAAIIYYMYAFNIFSLLMLFIPDALILIVGGWAIGFFCCALLMYSGQKAQAFVLPITWVLMPLTGVFYPISLLPKAMQTIAYMLPQTYIFEYMRLALMQGIYKSHLMVPALLTIIYFIISLLIFIFSFTKAKQYGFARLE